MYNCPDKTVTEDEGSITVADCVAGKTIVRDTLIIDQTLHYLLPRYVLKRMESMRENH